MEFLQNIFSRIRNWFSEIWQKTERRDRVRFLVIAGIALTLIIAASIMLNNSRYQTVMVNESASTLSTASSVLAENGISSKVSGGDLLVDKSNYDSAYALLMLSQLGAEEPNYSIYALAQGLTSVEADRNEYRKFQYEDNLRKVLEGFPDVTRARVMIYQPDNSGTLFASERQDTSVSVFLTLANPSAIVQSQIKTMEDAIANAIGITDRSKITISDQNMRRLNAASIEDTYSNLTSNYAFERQIETDFLSKVSTPLGVVLGYDNFTAACNVGVNFDIHTIQKKIFEPVVDEDGIIRSMQTINEEARGNAAATGQPGTDEDGLGDDYAEVDAWINEYSKQSDTINYEINEIIEMIEKAQGEIEDVTFTVTVNTYLLNEENRNADLIRAIVGGAVGLLESEWESRIFVNFQPFTGTEEQRTQQENYYAQIKREQMYALIQTIVMYLIIGICVILLIWRTFAFLKPKEMELPEATGDYLVGDAAEYSNLVEAAVQSMELEVTKTPSRERVEEFIESNPEAVANMLRTWLADEGEKSW